MITVFVPIIILDNKEKSDALLTWMKDNAETPNVGWDFNREEDRGRYKGMNFNFEDEVDATAFKLKLSL